MKGSSLLARRLCFERNSKARKHRRFGETTRRSDGDRQVGLIMQSDRASSSPRLTPRPTFVHVLVVSNLAELIRFRTRRARGSRASQRTQRYSMRWLGALVFSIDYHKKCVSHRTIERAAKYLCRLRETIK